MRIRPHVGGLRTLASILYVVFYDFEMKSMLETCQCHVGGLSHLPSAVQEPETEEVPFQSIANLLGLTFLLQQSQ